VPSGIIVISVITVGNAVQINRSCLRSVYFNYLSRITGHAASWCQNNLQTLYTGGKTRHNMLDDVRVRSIIIVGTKVNLT
jgi:hypothetical protein